MKSPLFNALDIAKSAHSSWLDSLTETITGNVPKDFYTLREIAQHCGMSTRQTSQILRNNIESGSVVVKKFRVKSGQRTMPIPHYGPAKCKR